MSPRSEVIGLAHIGIRAHDYTRSRAFYEQLGFVHLWGPVGSPCSCATQTAT